jgi:hypothetical protein
MLTASSPRKCPDFKFVLAQYQVNKFRVKTRYRELNLVGLRNSNGVLNQWSDFIGAFWYENNIPYYKMFRGTTLPGRYYLIDRLLNPNGCAVVVSNEQYKDSYKLGLHKGSQAFVQRSAVKFFRDRNKNSIIEETYPRVWGMVGLNIHSTRGLFPFVNKHSAGCQVIADPVDFAWLLTMAEESASRYGEKFDYTLLDF